MLSPWDEYPIHQTPHPIGRVVDSNPGFDDGYFFGVFNAEHRVFLFTGLRVNPNTDLVGAYAGILRDGVQRTVRFSRTWRQDQHTRIGPYAFDVVEPYRDIHLTLGANDSGFAFDLHWLGSAPAFQEAHHRATRGGRVVTDQTRYSQPGTAAGWIELDGERIPVDPATWYASRDHSWGLYFERAPLAPDAQWLPPSALASEGTPRALRFWTLFGAPGISGFYGIHEDPDGRQVPMNDTFGTPFEGRLYHGWDGPEVDLVAGRHELEFEPGTRLLQDATIHLTDSEGGEWVQRVRPMGVPWITATIGYQAGSWRDGGSMRTYHGGPDPAVEWDEFDVSAQPLDHEMYDGRKATGLCGKEYVSAIETIAPDGTRWVGAGHTELFVDGRYSPYGFAE